MTLDQIIHIANDGYKGFDVVQRFYEALEMEAQTGGGQFGSPMIGDTLAEFIVRELRSTFEPEASDEEQLQEASRAMECAVKQLLDVREAFEEASRKETPCPK